MQESCPASTDSPAAEGDGIMISTCAQHLTVYKTPSFPASFNRLHSPEKTGMTRDDAHFTDKENRGPEKLRSLPKATQEVEAKRQNSKSL